MEIYNAFASVYDLYMEDVPYDEWVDYIEALWARYGIKPNLVLDLGCGTGNVTIPLAKKGYEMIGIDYSADMLSIAREKSYGTDILYLQQDMRGFELYGTIDACICVCDSINYILEGKEFTKILKLVHNYLNINGYFIFDINTEYTFKNLMGDNSFGRSFKDSAFVWENYYDHEQKINEYMTDFFVKDQDTGLYERHTEFHYEKAYSVEEIKDYIDKSGLLLVDVFNAFEFSMPTEESERIYFICKKGR